MRRFGPLLFALAVSLVATPNGIAQQQFETLQKGFQPEKLYHFVDIDNVNIYNGNLIIPSPIGLTYPLNGGLTYNLTLTYNSKAWDLKPGPNGLVHTVPSQRSNAGIGWLLGVGRFISHDDPSNSPQLDIYEAPDGGDHQFDSVHTSDTNCGSFGCPAYTSDGSSLRLRYTGNLQREVDSPDGVIRHFTKILGVWTLTQIRSAFGTTSDAMSLSSQTTPSVAQCPAAVSYWKIDDSRGRTHYVCFKNQTVDGSPISMVDRVVLSPIQGASPTFFFHYHNSTVPKGPEDDDSDSGWSQTHDVALLDTLTLPDNSSYVFNHGAPAAESIQLASMIIPTGGKISYTYSSADIPALDMCAHAYSGFGLGLGSRTVGVIQRDFTPLLPYGQTPVTQTWKYIRGQGQFSPAAGYISIQNCTPPTPEDPNRDPTHVTLYDEMVVKVTDPIGNYVENHFSVWPGQDIGRDAMHGGGSPDVSPAGFQRQFYSFPYGTYDSAQNRFLSQEIFDCASGCSAKRTIYVRHDVDPPAFAEVPPHRLASQRTVFRDDCTNPGNLATCRWTQTDSTGWDTWAHYRSVATTANFGNNGDSRSVNTSFNMANGGTRTFAPADPWLLNTYDDIVTSEGSHSSTEQACFDHTTGFLTGRRNVFGAAPAGTDVITVFTKDSDNNLFTENYFGGDTASVTGTANDTNLCTAISALSSVTPEYQITHLWQNGQMASSSYAGATFLSLDLTIDASGLISKSRDTTGLETSYSYDTSGRLVSVTPPGMVPTSYTYSNAVRSGTLTQPATVDAVTTSTHGYGTVHRQYQFDSFGRFWREKHLMPDNTWSVRETLFDAKNRKRSVSELEKLVIPPDDPNAPPNTPPHTEFDFSPAHKTQYSYDGSDRPIMITAPDSKVSTIQYAGIRTTTRTVSVATGSSETNVSTTETYDGQGRLAGLTEAVNTPLALPLTTTYSYDVVGRLSGVSMPGENGTQTRAFVYDNRGLLVSETHPELGVNGNGSVNYGEYDSRGHAHRKTTGSFDLRTSFDPAERVTQVTDISVTPNRPLKVFAYDSFGVCTTTTCNGRLAATARYNYDADLGTVAATESYQYDVSNGRPSRRDRSVGSDGAFVGDSFFFTQAYTDLGDTLSIAYPCRSTVSGGCNPSDRTPRTVQYGYTNGFLTQVGAWAPTISYQPSGLLQTVTHGAGSTAVKETWTGDSSGMARPAQISSTDANGNTLFTTGGYSYDGGGNIKQIGTTTYTYDPFGRLASWTVAPQPPSFSTTRVGYDRFGNNLLNTLRFCGAGSDHIQRCGLSNVLAHTVLGSTNHYVGMTYDAAGNVTNDGRRSFSYDPLGMTTRTLASGRDFRHIYDAEDERIAVVERIGGANKTTWTLRGFANQLLSVWTDDRTNETTVTWKEDEVWRGSILLVTETTSTSKHMSLDHLGSPRLITNGATGQTIGTQDFSPFGSGGSLGSSALQFTSHERDAAEVGDGTADIPDYMHARFYDPAVGRLLSPDPAFDPTTRTSAPQTWNRYGYASNNPLRLLDPDGRAVKDFTLITKDQNHVKTVSPSNEQADHPETLGLESSATKFLLKTNLAISFDEGDNLADYKVERSVKLDTGITRDIGVPRIDFRSGAAENPKPNQIANEGQTKYVYDSPGLTGKISLALVGSGTWRGVFEVKVYNTKTHSYDPKRYYYGVAITYANGKATDYVATAIKKETYCASIGGCKD